MDAVRIATILTARGPDEYVEEVAVSESPHAVTFSLDADGDHIAGRIALTPGASAVAHVDVEGRPESLAVRLD